MDTRKIIGIIAVVALVLFLAAIKSLELLFARRIVERWVRENGYRLREIRIAGGLEPATLRGVGPPNRGSYRIVAEDAAGRSRHGTALLKLWVQFPVAEDMAIVFDNHAGGRGFDVVPLAPAATSDGASTGSAAGTRESNREANIEHPN